MSRIREMNRAIYDQAYKRLPLVEQQDKWKCFYCGQPAGTIDHQPPLSVIGDFLTSSWGFECVQVPSCMSCNAILSNFASTTLSERFMELKQRLRKRYKDELDLSDKWTIEEILELGPTLQRMVLGGIALGADAHERLTYPGHSIETTIDLWHDGGVKRCPECGVLYEEQGCPVCAEQT